MRNDPQFNDEFAPALVDERIEQLLQVPIPLQSSDASLVHDLRGLYQEDQLILAHARARIFQDVLDENDVPFDAPLPAYEWHDPSINNTRVNSRRYSPTRQQPPRPQQARTLRVALLAAAVLAIVLVGSMASFAYFAHRDSHQTTVLGPKSASTPTPSLLYSSLMSSPDRGGWEVVGSATLGCTYNGGGYQIGVNSSSTFVPCMARNLTGSNFVFQARMTIASASNDGGGLIFRGVYRFHVINGAYDLATSAKQLVAGSNSAINLTTGQSILLSVVANGSNISLYANNALLAHITDSTASSGAFGLLAVDFSHPTTAVFTDVSIQQQ